MRINGKEIKQNEHMTFAQTEYVKARIEILAANLEKKGYEVSIEQSNMSEAIYMTINDQTVSFRNHDYFSGIPVPEHTVWLSRFDTWTDAKNYFLNTIIPQMNGERIEKKDKAEKPSQESLIAEAEKKLTATTDPNMKMVLESRIKHLKGAM